MRQLLRKFVKDEQGLETVEYAIIAGLIVVGVIATVMKALERRRPPGVTASIPADFFGPAPTSDAAGYVLEAGVPVVSWIGCPYYLLDQHDTLDKVDKTALVPIAGTVAEMIGIRMAMT